MGKGFETILSLSFALLCMVTTTHAETTQQVIKAKNFWRDTGTGVSYGNFKKHEYRRLFLSGSAEVFTKLVSKPTECIQACLAESSCWSVNVERRPNRDLKLRCEILSTDKYNSSADDLKNDREFDHYSIEVFGVLLH